MDISKITDQLYVGARPKGEGDYDILHELAISFIINMRVERQPYPDPFTPPIETLWLPSFDHQAIPIPVEFLAQGVQAALPRIKKNEKVFVHCAEGVHRSVAMAAAILIAAGFSVEEATALIKRRRPKAAPNTEHIIKVIRQFEVFWSNRG